MKKYIYLTIGIIFVVLFGYLTILQSQYDALEKDYYITKSNEKVLLLDNDSLYNNTRALTLSIEELEYTNDSILSVLNTTRKKLNIKDEELKSAHYLLNNISKTDTLFVRDTIFRYEGLRIDTLLGDKWCLTKLHLEYPNIVTLDTSYNSELSVFAYSNKETVDPPKSCWLGRLFQPKHKVIRVEVTDNNPYSNIKEQKFVIIE